MPKYAFFIALLILFPYFQVHAEEAEEQAATTMRPSPLESDSDHFGLLRGYGPVSVNDVTGVVRVQLPRIGPSSLLSVQPVVRTLDAAELAYASVWGHLIDNFNAVGLGGSIGWGHLFVLDPTEMLFDGYGPRPITWYRHGGGTPDVFKRDYLFQTSNAAPLGDQDDLFTCQNTIDQDLRRLSWRDPGNGVPFEGDFVMLEPGGRKITFRRRLWDPFVVDAGQSRLYYPVKVEDPDGEWVTIHYHTDSDGSQMAMMHHLEDNHGRKLVFHYHEPLLAGTLKEIRLLQPGQDPFTDTGHLLASFTYTTNGYTGLDGAPSLSLHTLTTAQGHVWELDWETVAPQGAVERVTLPSQGWVHLDWIRMTLPIGRYPNETAHTSTHWRVNAVQMVTPEEVRGYQYRYETENEEGLLDSLLKVTIDGPDGLSQATKYGNMQSRELGLLGSDDIDVLFPCAGYPVWRRTSFNGTTQTETWLHEPVYLWATPFQPPQVGIVGSPAANAINWLVRPKRYSVQLDGQWFETTYGYGFNHAVVDQFSGSPAETIARPAWLEQRPADGTVRYRRDLTYLNRGRVDGECHEYLGDTPYARGLTTSSRESVIDGLGTVDVLARTSSEYGEPALPFPTRTHQWATTAEAITTSYEYYASGPHAGKLSGEYTGPDPAGGTLIEDYVFGAAARIQMPLLPASEHTIDYRGNVRSTTETGVTSTFDYDLADRIVRTKQPTMLDAVATYSPPGTPHPETTAYYEDGAAARKWRHTVADGWQRPVLTESDVDATLTGAAEIQYNALGQMAKTIAAAGSWTTTGYDVHDRPVNVETYTAAGALVQRAGYAYASFPDGTSRTTETILRDGKTTIKTTLTDLAGRVIETGINPGRPGAGGGLASDDYAGGGITRFDYDQDPATGLTTVTTLPYGLEDGSGRIEVRDMLGRSVSVSDPETDGTTTFTYDERGLPAFATHPDGKKYQFIHDAAGRLVEQRLRTQIAPERFDLVVLHNSYHPVHGYLETQVRKLGSDHARAVRTAREPDALGRPTRVETRLPEPLFWQPELVTAPSGEQRWHCSWRPLLDGSGLAAEYVFELKPLASDRASLYFAQIHQAAETDETIAFALDNAALRAAIDAQLADGPDRDAWLAEAGAGTLAGTVLDPGVAYRFRVTGIDGHYQATLPSYWWGDLPDLIVDHIDVVLNGSQAAVDLRVFNAGSKPAAETSTHLYLSQTATLAADAEPAAIWATPAIAPGFAVLHSLPALDVTGFAYLIIVADSEQAVTELEENNNLGRQFLAHMGSHDPALPDVLVEEMNYAYVQIGERYETYATYAIQNVNTTLATSDDGTVSDGSAVTKLYFSSDNVISNDDRLLATPECPPLGPLAREIQTTNLGTLDSAIPLHETHLVAAANAGLDGEPHFREGGNHYNNVSTVELPRLDELGPDLVVANFVHDGVTGSLGNYNMSLDFTIHNRGVWQAGPSRVGFYYSTDAVLDGGDPRLLLSGGGDGVAIAAVAPGWDARAGGSATVHIPDREGYLIVFIDPDEEVVESDETNNWRAHTFAGYADLVVEAFARDPGTGAYSFRVTNIDQLASEPTVVDLFVDFEDEFHPFRSTSVWQAALPALDPGATSTTFTTPAGWAPPASNRDQYLLAVVDGDGLVHERDESNNSSPPLLVPASGQADDKPDLIPDRWGFTRHIWPEHPEPLTAPDVAVGEFSAWYEQSTYSLKPLQGSYRLRVAVGTAPIEVRILVIASADEHFGSADDHVLRDLTLTFSEDTDLVMPLAAGSVFNPPKDHVQLTVTSNVAETRATNNIAWTRFSLPRVMAVHAVTNQSSVGCGPSTVEVYMSRDNTPAVSPTDDLIALYLHPGFSHGGSDVGHMIAYDATFMDSFSPLDGWTVKFVVDSLDVIDEADETNNVLVVDADPANYDGPWLPRGLPPLPDPQDGTFSSQELTIDRSTAVTEVHGESFLATAAEGVYEVAFRLENHAKKALALANLNIFAAYDFGLKGRTALVFSSALVGDATGERTIPAVIPAQGETGVTRYRLRVPRAFRAGQYKLVFVANAHVKSSAEGATLLSMSEPQTRILGFIEPARLLQ